VKLSVWPNPGHPPAEVLDTARWADSAGFHGIWYADHYMPNSGTEEVASGPVHECWSMLPAMAAVTERIRLGPLVAPTSVHHPALLANRAATIDHISGGRFVLGIGAGWQINEHHAYGIELEAPKQRVDRFEEAIRIVRSLLDEDRTTFQGSVFTITDAPSEPKPVQSKLPILVGTASPRMLRITARHADEWNSWGTPSIAAKAKQGLQAACESVGRDPATVWTSVQALVVLSDDPAAIDKAKSGPMAPRTICGGAAELVDTLGEYEALGFDEYILPDWNLGRTLEPRLEALEQLQTEVFAEL
jgi:probable F420-dependent oxidoreductase